MFVLLLTVIVLISALYLLFYYFPCIERNHLPVKNSPADSPADSPAISLNSLGSLRVPPLLREKIGPEVYKSLKVYEKAFEDLDEMNLMVQYLVKEGRCTSEHIKKHLKLYEEIVMDAYNMNAKLKEEYEHMEFMRRGLLEKEEYEHMEFKDKEHQHCVLDLNCKLKGKRIIYSDDEEESNFYDIELGDAKKELRATYNLGRDMDVPKPKEFDLKRLSYGDGDKESAAYFKAPSGDEESSSKDKEHQHQHGVVDLNRKLKAKRIVSRIRKHKEAMRSHAQKIRSTNTNIV